MPPICFPIKLWNALKHSEDDDLIRWSDDGQSVIVNEALFDEFAHKYHPKLLRTLNSFGLRRMFYWYGFKRTAIHPVGSDAQTRGEELVDYRHPKFLRHRPDLVGSIISRYSYKQQARNRSCSETPVSHVTPSTSNLHDDQRTLSDSDSAASTDLDNPTTATRPISKRRRQAAATTSSKCLENTSLYRLPSRWSNETTVGSGGKHPLLLSSSSTLGKLLLRRCSKREGGRFESQLEVRTRNANTRAVVDDFLLPCADDRYRYYGRGKAFVESTREFAPVYYEEQQTDGGFTATRTDETYNFYWDCIGLQDSSCWFGLNNAPVALEMNVCESDIWSDDVIIQTYEELESVKIQNCDE